MATNYSTPIFHPLDPETEARAAQREAERYRVAMRSAPTEEAEARYRELAQEYQDRAVAYWAQVKRGGR